MGASFIDTVICLSILFIILKSGICRMIYLYLVIRTHWLFGLWSVFLEVPRTHNKQAVTTIVVAVIIFELVVSSLSRREGEVSEGNNYHYSNGMCSKFSVVVTLVSENMPHSTDLKLHPTQFVFFLTSNYAICVFDKSAVHGIFC